MKPRISVVVVTYRSRGPVTDCLRSLERCRESLPLEAIVVDNASTDGTAEWVHERFPWAEVIANPDNRGFTRAVNQGFVRARADHVLMLNPDCEVPPGVLEMLLVVLEAEPGLAAVAPLLTDERGRAARSCGRFPHLWWLLCDHLGLAAAFPDSPRFGGYKYGGIPMDRLERVDWASGAALLIPAATWRRLGGLDEALFMYMEEVDWCRRAAAAGEAVRLVPAARIRHAGGLSSKQVPGESYLHNLRSRVYYFRKHFGPAAALAARAILGTSLMLKWTVSAIPRSRRAFARVYAAGIAAVWAAGRRHG